MQKLREGVESKDNGRRGPRGDTGTNGTEESCAPRSREIAKLLLMLSVERGHPGCESHPR